MKSYLQKIKLLVSAMLLLMSYASFAQITGEAIVTDRPDTIPAGVQGSVNPLTDNTKIITGAELLDDSFPGSWPLFGTDVRMKIGGYVKADFIHDFNYIGDKYEFELGSIAVEGSPERELGGITTFHSKQTRFNFDFRSKAKWKNGKEFPMHAFVELDFFFDSEALQFVPRFRLAYGVIGRLLVGRSWTNGGDLTTLPGLIDFSAGDALYGGRATQIRWKDRLGKNFTYVLAIEEAAGQIDNPDNLEGAFRSQYPQLTGNIRYQSKNGSSFQLGLDVFELSWRGPAGVPKVTKTGYGISGTGRFVVKVSEYSDSFMYGGGFGNGQGGRLIALSWDGKASGVVTDNGLDLNQAWWAFAGYNHYWTKSLNSTIATNWGGTELTPDQTDNTIKKAGSFHANLIWFPYPMISTGIEYMWGMRENKDGIQGAASRVQLMMKFKFN